MQTKLSPEELKKRRHLRTAVYYQANKEKIKARAKIIGAEYRKNNPHKKRNKARAKIADAKYRNNNPNKTSIWKQNNPEKNRKHAKKYRELNKEKITSSQAKWRVVNKEKIRLYWQNRGKRKRTGTLTKGLVGKLLKIQNYQCIYCGLDLRINRYHIDHIMPLALGGLNIDKNIQLTCVLCNLKKGYKHPDTFKLSTASGSIPYL